MTALTWVGMNGAYVMTNSRVNANISVVSIVSQRLKIQFKLNTVRQDQPSMKSSLITGKFTSQEPI